MVISFASYRAALTLGPWWVVSLGKRGPTRQDKGWSLGPYIVTLSLPFLPLLASYSIPPYLTQTLVS